MRIAIASKNSTLYVWNLLTREKLSLQKPHVGIATRATYAKVVQFSPDGMLLLSVEKESGVVDIWNSFSGEWLRSLGWDDQPYHATTARFSPDGQYIASGSEDGTVRLWNTVDWSAAAVFGEHPMAVSRMAFSPDGEVLVSGAKDGSVCLRKLRDLRVRGWIQDAHPTGTAPPGRTPEPA